MIYLKSRSPTSGYVKKNTFVVGGYGENDIGPFTLEGTVTLIAPDKMQEKDGLKNFKKLKVAKVELRKRYMGKVLEEMVEEKEAAEEEPGEMESESDFDLGEIQDPDFVRALEMARMSRLEAKQSVQKKAAAPVVEVAK